MTGEKAGNIFLFVLWFLAGCVVGLVMAVTLVFLGTTMAESDITSQCEIGGLMKIGKASYSCERILPPQRED